MTEYRLNTLYRRVGIYSLLVKKYTRAIDDFLKRMETEDNKPYVEQYLITPRRWYMQQLNSNLDYLKLATKHIEAIEKEINNNVDYLINQIR